VEFAGGRGEAVVHPEAVFAGFDEAGAAEVGEVAGDLGLGGVNDADEVADAGFAGLKKVEDTEASAVGEGSEGEVGRNCGGGGLHICLNEYRRGRVERQVLAR
jgi:hypothetical protein